MKLLQFKTDMNCECCVRSLVPYMAAIKGMEYWDVNIYVPEKTLKVGGNVSRHEVTEAVEKAEFKIERLR
ncbi:MAG: hypothetical protein WD555_01970 [Fulvivirga sp.]